VRLGGGSKRLRNTLGFISGGYSGSVDGSGEKQDAILFHFLLDAGGEKGPKGER
jgi:hypothetical protein